MPNYRTPGIYVEEIVQRAEAHRSGGHERRRASSAATPRHRRPPARGGGDQQLDRTSSASSPPRTRGARRCRRPSTASSRTAGAAATWSTSAAAAASPAALRAGAQGLAALEEIDEVAIVAAPGYTDAGSLRRAALPLREDEGPRRHPRRARGRGRHRPARPGGHRRGARAHRRAARRRSRRRGPTRRRRSSRPDGPAPAHVRRRLRRLLLPVDHHRGPARSGDAGQRRRRPGTWPASRRARTRLRGVHKAPANELVRGALNVTYRVTREEQGELNPNGVNCIRYFPREGIRVWGARTLAAGAERVALPERAPAVQHDRGVDRAKAPAGSVFEPNDRTLWKSIRRDVERLPARGCGATAR